MNGTLSFYEGRFSGEELVGTPNPYLMQNNLFELFARTGGRDAKNSGTSVCAFASPESPGATFTIFVQFDVLLKWKYCYNRTAYTLLGLYC